MVTKLQEVCKKETVRGFFRIYITKALYLDFQMKINKRIRWSLVRRLQLTNSYRN